MFGFFNFRRWLLRPKYELLEAGTNPLDDDELMQREKRNRKRSLWQWFLLAWLVALAGSIWFMLAQPGNNGGNATSHETPATLMPGTGGVMLPTLASVAATDAATLAAGDVGVYVTDAATQTGTPTQTPTITPTPTKTPLLNDFWGGGNDTILTITPFGQKPDVTATPTPSSTPPSAPALVVNATTTPRAVAYAPAATATPWIVVRPGQVVNVPVTVEVTRIVEVPYPQPVEVTRIVYVEVGATPTPQMSAGTPPHFLVYIPMVRK